MTAWKPIATAPKDGREILLSGKQRSGAIDGVHIASAKWQGRTDTGNWHCPLVKYQMKWLEWAEIPK